MLNRKYDVYDLSVIKVVNGGITHFYIAYKDGLRENLYVEVLNKTKFLVPDESIVTPLSKYYSVLGVCNYSTGEHLKLTREDILRKTIQINMDYAIMQYEEEMNRQLNHTSMINDLEERLNKATVNFFPKHGSWSASEFTKSDSSLIQHLRDDKWLATRLQHTKELQDVFFGSVYNYVRTSSFFKEERHAYEQRVVKWQIGWMMGGGDGWLVSDEYGGDFINFDENYDIGFRLGIYRTLRAINMDSETIEEGIEANSDDWLLSCMRTAFRNNYEPILGFAGPELARMKPASEEHREAWIKLRKYQYYQDHKASVDKYGVVTPEMEMSLEEVEELKQYLDKMHKERMAYLEELKNAKIDGEPTPPPFVLTKTKNG